MLNLHKYRRNLNTELWIAHVHTLIDEYLASGQRKPCKNESIVIVISGNWEYETGLLLD